MQASFHLIDLKRNNLSELCDAKFYPCGAGQTKVQMYIGVILFEQVSRKKTKPEVGKGVKFDLG